MRPACPDRYRDLQLDICCGWARAHPGPISLDRRFGDDAARKGMLTIFEALGPDSDLVRRYRRELASAINR
jgi:hypothetical protein